MAVHLLWPVCHPITSARPGNCGEIRSIVGKSTKRLGYAWWIARLRHALQLADLVRIDHFRGFVAYWEVPADAPNAINGKWVPGPGEKLFEAFEKAFPHLPIIAEDLGLITPDVIELRDKFNLPGMRILQFAFGDGESNFFLAAPLCAQYRRLYRDT